MRFQPAAVALVGVLLAACTANLNGQGAPDGEASTHPPSVAVDRGCDADEPSAVPKLLRLSHFEFRSVVSDLFESEVAPELFANWTPLSEVYGFDTMSEARIDARGLDEQLRTVETLAEMALTAPLFTRVCAGVVDEAIDWPSCGKAFISEFGSRAFRRPLAPDEASDYGALFTDLRVSAEQASLPVPGREALLGLVQAVLLSPHLTFKPELVPGGFDVEHRSFARASKVSLFLRSSIPDAELWAAAMNGDPLGAESIESHARRMLDEDPSRFASAFGGQWLGFRDLPLESDALLLAMRDETRAMFSSIFESDLPPGDLLQPGFTIVSRELAEHYSLSSVPGDGHAGEMRISTFERGGVLSQGYFLKRTATGSDFRRAVHRGLWVITRLLCQEIPRIDAATLEEISASFESIDRTLPLSEQMEIHRNSAGRCSGCHDQIDPIGLALENYDAEGLWRDVDPQGHPLTTDLELLGQVVDGPSTLATVIKDSQEFSACVATKLLTYALSRGPHEAERCAASEFMLGEHDVARSLKEAAIHALLSSFEMTETTHE